MFQRQYLSHKFVQGRVVRSAIAVLGLLACAWGIWFSGRTGFSRLLAKYAMATGLAAPADEAVRLSPSDPEAHFARANVLANSGELSEAVREFEQAARLRPEDYYLWLMLGTARYQAGDERGALLAFGEAVRLAPFYAQPHFQLGNELYVVGQQDEAIAELRRAALSDPSLLPYTIDLAWKASAEDAQAVERIIRPQDAAARLALARFFAGHGKTAEAIALFHSTDSISDEDRRALLDELLKAGKFHEAYEVWAAHNGRGVGQSQSAPELIRDGGFESPINLDEQGFGWRRGHDVQAVRLSLDKNERQSGAYSLRVDFAGGNNNPRLPIISQLVLVEPKSHYRLRFAARTGELVTGGLPVIAVADAGGKEGTVIAQSKPLPGGTSDWQDYSVEFATGERTSAVKIIFRRQDCNFDQCPVFGHAWLDSFSIQKQPKS